MQTETVLSIIAYILGVVGFLVVIIGGLITYIFREHCNENKISFDENRQDHIRVHERIDTIMGKGKK